MRHSLSILLSCVALAPGLGAAARAADPGDQVVVVYNRNQSESKGVAEHYAKSRHIPAERVFGLDLPAGETISRKEYESRLEKPLLKKLREAKLFVYGRNGHPPPGQTNEVPIEARIRYATLCYGVPLKILNDGKLNEPGMEKIRPELRRNDASVDSELALLPIVSEHPLYGAAPNRFYGGTNSAALSPTNGLLMVARLDGPTPEIARGLVDKALEAEREGLWGRAYFDARGLTNGSYKIGDDWIRGAAQVVSRLGFETVVDNEPATFAASFPMSQIALYAGWYDWTISGPFTLPTVEFMPGAFAYHLQSFSAQTLHSATANWVGPLLAKGATISMGCVEEPYLEGTPDVMTFLIRLIYLGFTFGEAAYTCQGSLSWQTTVVGDPLYRPFGKPAIEQHQELLAHKSKFVDWSYLRAVDMNLANGVPPLNLVQFLENLPETQTSAVLLEREGDLYFLKAQWVDAIAPYRKALTHSPSPQQRVRLMLSLARCLSFAGKGQEELAVYEEFVKTCPDYPDLQGIYRRIAPLAEQFGSPEQKQKYQQQAQRVTPGATTNKP